MTLEALDLARLPPEGRWEEAGNGGGGQETDSPLAHPTPVLPAEAEMTMPGFTEALRRNPLTASLVCVSE